MSIQLNKVGIDIDGKVYNFYKMSFGFQRKLIEVQSNLSKKTEAMAKKYGIAAAEVTTSAEVSDSDKLELAKASLDMQDALAGLFVDPEEAKILDNFDAESVKQLIEALQ